MALCCVPNNENRSVANNPKNNTRPHFVRLQAIPPVIERLPLVCMRHFGAEHRDDNLGLSALCALRPFVVELDAVATESEVVDSADESSADQVAVHPPGQVLISLRHRRARDQPIEEPTT